MFLSCSGQSRVPAAAAAAPSSQPLMLSPWLLEAWPPVWLPCWHHQVFSDMKVRASLAQGGEDAREGLLSCPSEDGKDITLEEAWRSWGDVGQIGNPDATFVKMLLDKDCRLHPV